MPKVEAIARYPQLPFTPTSLHDEQYKVANILEMHICTLQSFFIISLPPLVFSFLLMMYYLLASHPMLALHTQRRFTFYLFFIFYEGICIGCVGQVDFLYQLGC